MNHKIFDKIIIGSSHTQSNTSIVFNPPFQSRNMPPHAQRFLNYLQRGVIRRWRNRARLHPTFTDLITVRIPVVLFGEANCEGITNWGTHTPKRFKIKRVSFEGEAWDEFGDADNHGNWGWKRRAYYIAGQATWLLNYAWVTNINSAQSLRRLVTQLRSGNNAGRPTQYLGMSMCSQGNVERVDVPEYARRCGIGSSLVALCFNDAETKRDGGEDLDNNAIWNRITDSQTNPDFWQWSLTMMARMQLECRNDTLFKSAFSLKNYLSFMLDIF